MAPQTMLKNLLVERGIATDLKESIGLILAGKIVVNDQMQDKPGTKVSRDALIRVKGESLKYVSRAGDKLEGVITDSGLAAIFNHSVVLDVGASTGGFVDCALKFGANAVFAVDVGTNQLDWKLRNHPQVTCFEKTDIRKFRKPDQIEFDIIVCDVSFTSLAFITDALKNLSNKNTILFLLIKPQFEAFRDQVEPGGLITNEVVRQEIILKTIESLKTAGLEVLSQLDSKVKGKTGNLESWAICKISSS